METNVIVVLTIISLALSFSKKILTIQSISLDIKKKKLEISQIIAQINTTPAVQPSIPARWKTFIRTFLPDIFSSISLIAVAYKLWGEYYATVPLSREIIFNVALLCSIVVFNVISLSTSRLNRRLNYWTDEYMTAFEQLFDLIKIIDGNAQMAVENIVRKNNN
jgi:hypothetical protein